MFLWYTVVYFCCCCSIYETLGNDLVPVYFFSKQGFYLLQLVAQITVTDGTVGHKLWLKTLI